MIANLVLENVFFSRFIHLTVQYGSHDSESEIKFPRCFLLYHEQILTNCVYVLFFKKKIVLISPRQIITRYGVVYENNTFTFTVVLMKWVEVKKKGCVNLICFALSQQLPALLSDELLFTRPNLNKN